MVFKMPFRVHADVWHARNFQNLGSDTIKNQVFFHL